MTEANPLNPTRREILSQLTEEFRKTQRAIRNLQTEMRQIQVSHIRNEKALEKLERQINEQEDRLENAQKEPDKQENARQALERLKTKKQQLLDEQGTNAGQSDELDNRIQEMEQKKTTAQKKIVELENYLAHQLFSMALSRLAFFFMSMGVFLILAGLAGANWRNSVTPACQDVSVCDSWYKCPVKTAIGIIKCKIVQTLEQEAEKITKKLLQSVSEFLIVIGLVMFIIFGACWIGLERRKILNLPVTVAD